MEGVDPNTPKFRWVPNNTNGNSRNAKKTRSPVPDDYLIAAKAYCRSPSSTPTKASKNKYSDLPKPECQVDAYTGKTWIVFNDLIHEKKGWNSVSIKVKDAITSFYLEKEFPCEYKTNN